MSAGGWFYAVDPVGFTQSNPLSFNRYAYANNNPYKYVDPDGRNGVTFVGGLLTESYNFVTGNGFDGAMVMGALVDGYNGEGAGFWSSATEDVTTFVPVGEIAGAALKSAKLAKMTAAASRLCFVKGTLVQTKEGLKPIEEIQVGDLVESRDEATGDTSWKSVVELFQNHNKPVVNVTLVNSEGKAETLGATPEHPFWVVGQGWTEAGELQPGTRISTTGEQVLTVKTVEPDKQLHDTYNFEVADYHTYFVGENQAWVHNACSTVVEAAGRLGVDLQKINISNGVAKLRINLSETLNPKDIKAIKEYLKSQGASKAEIDTGYIANEKLDKFLQDRLQSGRQFNGGTVGKSASSDSDYTLSFDL